MTLHDRICLLQATRQPHEDLWDSGYNCGVIDSAKLAKEADELMEGMVASIGELQSWVTDGGNEDTRDGVAGMCGEARSVLAKYYNWKGRTK